MFLPPSLPRLSTEAAPLPLFVYSSLSFHLNRVPPVKKVKKVWKLPVCEVRNNKQRLVAVNGDVIKDSEIVARAHLSFLFCGLQACSLFYSRGLEPWYTAAVSTGEDRAPSSTKPLPSKHCAQMYHLGNVGILSVVCLGALCHSRTCSVSRGSLSAGSHIGILVLKAVKGST